MSGRPTYIWIMLSSTMGNTTVEPLLNRPSDGINGQFLCASKCSPNKWPLTGGHPRDVTSKSVQKNTLLTPDGRPVPVANVMINSYKKDAKSLCFHNSWPAFIFNVGICVIVYTKT